MSPLREVAAGRYVTSFREGSSLPALVERGESLNAGVILFCPSRRFLEARVGLDESRLRAIAPAADADQIGGWLDSVVQTARRTRRGRASASWSASGSSPPPPAP